MGAPVEGSSSESSDVTASVRPGAAPAASGGRKEERVRMTRLRQTVAKRLKEAQNTAAMLTTFNDVDMTEVMAARTRYKDLFEKKHGVRLGFMGFFVKAACQALRDIPAVRRATGIFRCISSARRSRACPRWRDTARSMPRWAK